MSAETRPNITDGVWVCMAWVDRPVMTSGKPADAVLGLMPWPRWWVTR